MKIFHFQTSPQNGIMHSKEKKSIFNIFDVSLSENETFTWIDLLCNLILFRIRKTIVTDLYVVNMILTQATYSL